MVQGLTILQGAESPAPRWQGTLLMWAALAVVVVVNTVGARLLPKIEGFILIIHTLGFFAVLIPLVYLAPHNNASFVFKDWIDTSATSGYGSSGLAFMVGLLSTNLPFIGTLLFFSAYTGETPLTLSRLRRPYPHGRGGGQRVDRRALVHDLHHSAQRVAGFRHGAGHVLLRRRPWQGPRVAHRLRLYRNLLRGYSPRRCHCRHDGRAHCPCHLRHLWLLGLGVASDVGVCPRSRPAVFQLPRPCMSPVVFPTMLLGNGC